MTTKTYKLTLDFATDKDRHEFIGWFLDGGGEQQMNDARELRDEPMLGSNGPGGGDWEWSTGSKAVPVADNYTIELRPYDDEDGDE